MENIQNRLGETGRRRSAPLVDTGRHHKAASVRRRFPRLWRLWTANADESVDHSVQACPASPIPNFSTHIAKQPSLNELWMDTRGGRVAPNRAVSRYFVAETGLLPPSFVAPVRRYNPLL